LGFLLLLGWVGPRVCEVLRAAFSSETRAATPGEICHCLDANLISGSEH
jgi:hypothetical protein